MKRTRPLLRSITRFTLRQGLAGPIVSAPADAYDRQLWDPPALLATTDPERVRRRFTSRGWLCLRGGLARKRLTRRV